MIRSLKEHVRPSLSAVNVCIFEVKLNSSLQKFYSRHHDLVNRCGISVSQMTTEMFHFPQPWLITGFVTRLTRLVPLVEQELLTLPEHLSWLPVFSGVPVTRSLVLCVCFVDHCWAVFTFFFTLCCVFFFYIQILITPLVPSNSS